MAVRCDEGRPENQTRQLDAGCLPARLIARIAAQEGCVHLALLAEGGASP